MNNYFQDVPANINLNQLEEKILQFWQEQQIFQKSINQRSADNEYIFYDGPPFANGLPHYGHILTSYIKDTVPRYFAMQGKRVERRFGWDCHGLPAENSAEKELNLSGKQQIEEYGIDKFNNYCRNDVMKYTNIWQGMINRLGRWVDFSHDYKTMDLSYMETVMWIFKAIYDKGLIYEGNKVLHYCYRCQTPLSNFEAKLDDAYRVRKDPSVTVLFKCLDLPNTYFAVWTTTPWTLPSNVLLAVGETYTYVEVEVDGKHLLIAEKCLERYKNEISGEIIKNIPGKELLNLRYEPIFPYFSDTQNAFRVVAGDFVTTEDGTGIVHIAPAFGEDDANVGNRERVKAPDPIDQAGCFTKDVSDFAGENVHVANEKIVKFLKQKQQVLKAEHFEHNYPYCWRCDTPLIYKAIPSWYLEVTKIKDQLLKNNEQINWVPEHIKHGIFGKWLEGVKDWSISRNRYWGAPVPVWKCKECKHIKVVGSREELAKLSGVMPQDLHRPAIDEITFKCEKCGGAMQRVPEVLDCWFESGSMPYAQLHYPFENKERFHKNFPADFIVEYISQTRGWFYTLMVLSTALFDSAPFRNAMVHGVIFAADGRKMSKRLKNYPDPNEVLTKYGSDAMRFYLISSPIIAGKNINFVEEGVQDVIRSLILPLWNGYRFFITYAIADKFVPEANGNLSSEIYLDRYILAKLQNLNSNVQNYMQRYDLGKACRELVAFIDILNNTYIRRSRRRFWKSESDSDKKAAYETLYYVLCNFCKIAAPFLPFLAEELYKNLTQNESVHLQDWPAIESNLQNEALVEEVERVEQIVKVGRMIREKAQVKVREPRAKVTISGVGLENLINYKDWILEELNIKELIIENNPEHLIEKHVKLDFKKLGPKLGKNVQWAIQEVKAGKFTMLDDKRLQLANDVVVEADEYQIEFKIPEGTMQTDDAKIMVTIDMTETPEFKKEGIVRDIVRSIQTLRKDADLNVSDRIVTLINTKGFVQEAINEYQDYIMRETLSTQLNFGDDVKNYAMSSEVIIDDIKVHLAIKKIIN
jgi:isoleucyl-tRNA synthetase